MVTVFSGVQTDLSKWFTAHVDWLTTHLNYKFPLYVSPVLDYELDALNINWSGLTAYAYPPHSKGDLKNMTMQLPHHTKSPRMARDALIFGM